MDERESGKKLNEPEESVVERELRQALRHVPAPNGFTDKVMSRVAVREAGRTSRPAPRANSGSGLSGLHRHAGWWTAIAAMLLAAAGGDIAYLRHQRTEREAARVRQQLDLAMELTSQALDKVDVGLERSHAARYTQMVLELGK